MFSSDGYAAGDRKKKASLTFCTKFDRSYARIRRLRDWSVDSFIPEPETESPCVGYQGRHLVCAAASKLSFFGKPLTEELRDGKAVITNYSLSLSGFENSTL